MDEYIDSFTGMMLQNYKLHFPLDAGHIVYYEPIGYDCLEIRLDSDEVIIFDNSTCSARRLPPDSDEMTEEQFKKEFGFRLRRILEHKGLTQMELSDATGIPQCHISGYINGKHTPSFYIMHKISKALRCSVDDFRYV